MNQNDYDPKQTQTAQWQAGPYGGSATGGIPINSVGFERGPKGRFTKAITECPKSR